MPIFAGIASAVIGAASANKAAKAQTNAANRDIAFQTETRDMIRGDVAPWRGAGGNALAAYNFELGLGPRPTFGGGNALAITETPGTAGRPATNYHGQPQGDGIPGTAAQFRVGDKSFTTREEAQAYATAHGGGGGTPYAGYAQSEDNRFLQEQGMAGLNALAGARGGLTSGRTMQDAIKFNQGIASQGRNQYLNRLAGLSDTGLNAATIQGTASGNAAQGVGNALGNLGNAQAAGAIGIGNAFNTGIGNVLGAYQYQKQTVPGYGTKNWLFGGGAWS